MIIMKQLTIIEYVYPRFCSSASHGSFTSCPQDSDEVSTIIASIFLLRTREIKLLSEGCKVGN